MANKTVLPMDTDSLIRWLDERYPHRCPDPRHDERKIWMDAGRRALIDALIHLNSKADPYDV